MYQRFYPAHREWGGAVGAEEQPAPVPELRSGIKVIPNPFRTQAKVPGGEGERFALYDVSGWLAGSYPGERIGMDVPPGVYFLRPETPRKTLQRVVKVR